MRSTPKFDGAILAEWVEARKFSTIRLRPGYDTGEVDAFANAIRDTFLGTREPSLTPGAIRTGQFSTTRLRPGYDMEEVDAFLDEAELRLAAQVSAWREAPAAEPESGVADPAAESVQIICPECGAESAETDVCARCGAPVAYQPSVAGDHAVGQRVSPGWSAVDVVTVGIGILVVIALIVGLPLLTGWQPGGP